MKKVLIIISAIAVMASSCSKEDVTAPEAEQVYGTFVFSSAKPVLDNGDGTKTEWTGSTIQWSANDQIRMAYTVDGVWQGASDSNTSPKLYASDKLTEASEVAQFTVSSYFTGTTSGTHIFYALYPGSLVSGTSFNNAPQASITIPSEQKPAADSFDSAADVMTGVSESFASKPTAAILMKWTRRVAHAQLTIKNLTVNSGETIQNITLKAQDGADLVGLHSLNLVTGEVSNPQGNTNTVTINADNLTYSGNQIEFWASFLPATLTELTVTVETDKAYYTRSFSGFTREFKRNKRNTMNIGMSSAVRTAKDLSLEDYEETFYSSLGDFTAEKETLPSDLTYVWTHDSNYHYAKGSAYKGGAKEAVSYLVSPEMTIGSTNSKLTFQHAANYVGAGNFSTYFSVVLFEGTSEHVLTLDAVPAGNSWSFVTSSVDLSAYKDKTIRIGFKYTSTSSVAGTWEIKNFKVTDVLVGQSVATGWLELPAATSGNDYYKGTFYDGSDRNYSYLYQYSTYTSLWTAYPLYSATMSSGTSSLGPVVMASQEDRGQTWAPNPIINEGKQVNVWDGSYNVKLGDTEWSSSMGSSEYYARGHQIPNADRAGNDEMQTQTYYATNSTPQIQNQFNASIWGSLEAAVRSSVKDTVYVVTGAAFAKVGETKSITYIHPKHDSGKNVPVPNYYWKVLLKVKRNGNNITSASAIGFWFDHQTYSNSDYTAYVKSVDQIETWTGFDFFANLPEGLQTSAETNTNWNTFKNF